MRDRARLEGGNAGLIRERAYSASGEAWGKVTAANHQHTNTNRAPPMRPPGATAREQTPRPSPTELADLNNFITAPCNVQHEQGKIEGYPLRDAANMRQVRVRTRQTPTSGSNSMRGPGSTSIGHTPTPTQSAVPVKRGIGQIELTRVTGGPVAHLPPDPARSHAPRRRDILGSPLIVPDTPSRMLGDVLKPAHGIMNRGYMLGGARHAVGLCKRDPMAENLIIKASVAHRTRRLRKPEGTVQMGHSTPLPFHHPMPPMKPHATQAHEKRPTQLVPDVGGSRTIPKSKGQGETNQRHILTRR